MKYFGALDIEPLGNRSHSGAELRAICQPKQSSEQCACVWSLVKVTHHLPVELHVSSELVTTYCIFASLLKAIHTPPRQGGLGCVQARVKTLDQAISMGTIWTLGCPEGEVAGWCLINHLGLSVLCCIKCRAGWCSITNHLGLLVTCFILGFNRGTLEYI